MGRNSACQYEGGFNDVYALPVFRCERKESNLGLGFILTYCYLRCLDELLKKWMSGKNIAKFHASMLSPQSVNANRRDGIGKWFKKKKKSEEMLSNRNSTDFSTIRIHERESNHVEQAKSQLNTNRITGMCPQFSTRNESGKKPPLPPPSFPLPPSFMTNGLLPWTCFEASASAEQTDTHK